MPSNEVAERGGAQDLAKPGPITLALLGQGEFPQVDPELVSRRIDAQLLSATSPDELLAVGKTDALESLLGIPLEVTAVVARPARLEGEGLSGFLICEAVNLVNGEDVVFTTSARNVALRLGIAADRGWLPMRFKVRKSDAPSERGFFPYIVESV